ncbi:putative disease resistance protein RGA1 [Triticum dicoccoides]|uniref:putative disease resistance protein RGA1 n=1 Tax=Triticum dicoccoides TaxID=85692 RepID=UPI00189075ED|nr:putative disease resistance protein RGA1 [Triticum dicoccoides]
MAQAILERACPKLRSAIGDEAVARLNFTGDLREMLVALEAIQPVLDKAEMQPLSRRWVSICLQHALSIAYKTIDIVDELQDATAQATATLSEYMSENNMFHKYIEERKTGPVFEEAMAVGRGSDKERIIAALLSTQLNIMQVHITILPIFGLACIGKTTLAQMVFNDTHSLQGFDFRVWVHVSPQFDFHTIGNSIICQVSGRGQEEINHASSDVEGMESIMKCLHELLDGKKVLLVLDDLWEEDSIQLQLLKSMLTFLGDKMEVIVTTCNQAIARKICTVEPYRLNRLSDDTCWEIIKKLIRFEGGGEELEKIGREIASKCCGVPSAAREYAGRLDSSRDVWRWKTIRSYIMAFESVPRLPLSSVELSYRSMPPDLRLCFAYCCQIFPTSHIIVKDDLVHHWIALHLIEPSKILSATQIAEEHITRLQDMKEDPNRLFDHALESAVLVEPHTLPKSLAPFDIIHS